MDIKKITLCTLLLATLSALLFALVTAQAPATPIPGKFAVVCDWRSTGFVDPIVSPGMRSGHRHEFAGGNVTPDSTRQSLINDKSTTCTISGDRSGYWAPMLVVDGKRIKPDTINSYYGAGARVPVDKVALPPVGWQAIAGHVAGSQGEDEKYVKFNCAENAQANLSVKPQDCSGGQHPVMRLVFPDCNNGQAKSSDHYSNNAYSQNGVCPAGYHPILQLTLAVHYPVTDNFSHAVLASGDYTTAHADVLDGFIRTTEQRLINRCVKSGPGCGIQETETAAR